MHSRKVRNRYERTKVRALCMVYVKSTSSSNYTNAIIILQVYNDQINPEPFLQWKLCCGPWSLPSSNPCQQ
jgi:hypothetical protein